MPWSAADADRHHKGLSAKQKRQWAAVANSQLATCLKKGGSQGQCEGQAVRAANAAVNKSADEPTTLVLEGAIAKADDSRQRLFGWASIAVQKDGTPLLDLQGDLIDIEDLEEAWYEYVQSSGELNFQHSGPVRGHLIEAMVFTPDKIAALGLPPDSMPQGAWVGFHLPESDDYQLVKHQGFFMFSIEGFAEGEMVDAS
jgi:hypothetical protein